MENLQEMSKRNDLIYAELKAAINANNLDAAWSLSKKLIAADKQLINKIIERNSQ